VDERAESPDPKVTADIQICERTGIISPDDNNDYVYELAQERFRETTEFNDGPGVIIALNARIARIAKVRKEFCQTECYSVEQKLYRTNIYNPGLFAVAWTTLN